MFSLARPQRAVLMAVLPVVAALVVGCGGSMGMVTSLLEVVGVRALVPKDWSSHGGLVEIVADVVSGESLKKVVAKIIRRNNPVPVEVVLVPNKDGKYEGVFKTSENPSEAVPVIYTAVVEATDVSGKTVVSTPVEVEVPPAP